MKLLTTLLGKVDISKIKLKREKKKQRTLLKDVVDNPESFKLEAYIDNDEIVIKVKRKDES